MEKMQVRLILEVLGRPKENVTNALKGLIGRITAEKGVKILEQAIHPPAPIKDAQNLFTSFAELTLELDSLSLYFGIIFAYMPSNIEVIYPEKINLSNQEFDAIANRLVQRLHDYDAIVKGVLAEKDILAKKLQEIAPDILQRHASSSPFATLSVKNSFAPKKIKFKKKKKRN